MQDSIHRHLYSIHLNRWLSSCIYCKLNIFNIFNNVWTPTSQVSDQFYKCQLILKSLHRSMILDKITWKQEQIDKSWVFNVCIMWLMWFDYHLCCKLAKYLAMGMTSSIILCTSNVQVTATLRPILLISRHKTAFHLHKK